VHSSDCHPRGGTGDAADPVSDHPEGCRSQIGQAGCHQPATPCGDPELAPAKTGDDEAKAQKKAQNGRTDDHLLADRRSELFRGGALVITHG
jgi:hypothetical protein